MAERKEENFKYKKKVITALLLLRTNKFKYTVTARELEISTNTLRTWKRRYAEDIYRDYDNNKFPNEIDEEYNTALLSVSTDLRAEKINFINESAEVKDLALRRVKRLLRDEKSIPKLIEVLRFLHEVTTGTLETKDGGVQSGTQGTNTYIQYIKSLYNIKQ